MRYTTSSYLSDSFWLVDFFLSLWKKVKPKIYKYLSRAIDFEYDLYIERVYGNLFTGFLIIYLGLIACFALTKYTERLNGVRISTITTNSISPVITPGSIVISAPHQKYSKNDLVTYKEVNVKTGFVTGKAITHRIIDEVNFEDGSFFVTKGDSNSQPDPGRGTKSDILGKVVLIIPFLGYFDAAIKSFPGFLIFIAIPAIYLIKHELVYLKEANRKRS